MSLTLMDRLPSCAQVLKEIADERLHQLDKGFNAAFDDENNSTGQLADGAAAFLCVYSNDIEYASDIWPFDAPFKPAESERGNLIKAAAMIVAEIQRLDRIAERAKEASQP